MSLDQLFSKLGTPYPAPGDETRWDCPFCVKNGKSIDTKGHLYLNSKRGVFFCQRCSEKGPLVKILRYFNLSTDLKKTAADWPKLVRNLSVFTGKVYDEDYDYREEVEYPCATTGIYPGFSAYDYLTRPKTDKVNGLSCRGLSDSTIDQYRIQLGASGTFWEHRIFIPTIVDNLVTFWVARDISNKSNIKYLNPNTRSRRYHVFNLDTAKNYDEVHITEGVFSSIAVGDNAVCTFGKYVTSEQLRQISSVGFKTYYVALDGDAKMQSIYVADWLKSRGKSVKVVPMDDGEDPDEISDYHDRAESADDYTFFSKIYFLL